MKYTSIRPVDTPPQIVGRAPVTYAQELQEFLERLFYKVTGGIPSGFNSINPAPNIPDQSPDPGDENQGWAAANHAHPTEADAAVNLVNTPSAEGTSDKFARADHEHQRDVWVEESGVDLDVVNALNFEGIDVVVEPNLTGSLLTDLYGYWSLDEASGTRRIAIGVGPDLLETGGAVASIAGKFNLAVDSNKTNTQYLKGTFTPRSFDAGLTVACWVNLDTNPPVSPGGIFALKNSAGSDAIWLARYYDGNGVEWGFKSPAGVSTSAAIPVLPSTGVWYLVVAWWDSVTKTAEIQVNNGAIYNSGFGLPATPIDITGWDFDEVYCVGGNGIVHGDVDALMVWDRMLTVAEREQLWISTRATISAASIMADVMSKVSLGF